MKLQVLVKGHRILLVWHTTLVVVISNLLEVVFVRYGRSHRLLVIVLLLDEFSTAVSTCVNAGRILKRN